MNDFTAGAWISDAWLGLKEAAHWRRVDIVSDVENIRHFTDKASKWIPGEYRGFTMAELKDAIAWAAAPEKMPVRTSLGLLVRGTDIRYSTFWVFCRL